MVKQKSVAFNEAQWAWLRKRAAKLSITEAELLRRIVDAEREKRA